MPNILELAGLAVLGFAAAMIVAHIALKRGFPLPDRSHRFVAIDGLRGFMALGVVVSHFMIWIHVPDRTALTASNLTLFETNVGKAPVTIFFMITAFLFYPRVRGGLRQAGWRYILVSRLFRLYPLYLTALAGSLALLWIVAGAPTDAAAWSLTFRRLPEWLLLWRWPDLLGVVRSKQLTLHPAWSLYWEWMFYLLLLPLTALAMSLRPVWIPHRLIPAGLFVGSYALHILWPASPATATYLGHFAAGMLVWEACQSTRFTRFMRRRAVGATCAVVALASLPLIPPSMISVLVFAPLFACVAAGNTLGGLLARRGSLVLGEASYGIYLLHPLLLSTLFLTADPQGTLRGPMLFALPLAMAGVTALAMLGFLLVERPMIERGHRIGRRFRPVAPTAAQATLATSAAST